MTGKFSSSRRPAGRANNRRGRNRRLSSNRDGIPTAVHRNKSSNHASSSHNKCNSNMARRRKNRCSNKAAANNSHTASRSKWSKGNKEENSRDKDSQINGLARNRNSSRGA